MMNSIRALRGRLAAFPLKLFLRASHWRERKRPRRPASFVPLRWEAGLSVVIPERGGGELLTDCLQGLFDALCRIDEEYEVIIVVNGSPRSEYQQLQRRYPEARWQFHKHPLGFSHAALEGVREARFGGIYLLNNDMRLQPEALREVLRWRGPSVFAIASQILFPDDGRRREETGWTFMPTGNDLAQPYHAESTLPDARGTVWAGAGSSLFHAATLRRMLPSCLVYDPFYWEDVDLGVRAYREGWESIYCPQSRALHLHRVTVQRYFPESEVARIFERNRLQLSLRGPLLPPVFDRQMRRLGQLDLRSIRDLTRWSSCRALWRARRQAHSAPIPNPDFRWIPRRRYRRPSSSPILMVSPFAILPPRHGGAVRSTRLAAELARGRGLILLSDEGDLYPETSSSSLDTSFDTFDAVYRIDGRPELDPSLANDRIARMNIHARSQLRDELCRLIDLHRPLAVMIEHMELAPLIEVRDKCVWQPPFWLNLQDVLLQPDDPGQAAADRAELALIDRYQKLIVCSAEDQALLEQRTSVLVPNGCDPVARADYQPSGGRNILFFGPFRAPINWMGIHDFAATIYPQLRARLSDVSLTVVGGPGARERAAALPAFSQPGIEIIESVDTLKPLLNRAALTINPQPSLRGSSLKVLESLASGRVCVSTRAGARGHLQHGFGGLIVCEHLSDFATPLLDLLSTPAHRHELEKADLDQLSDHSWSSCAAPLRQLAASLDADPHRYTGPAAQIPKSRGPR